MTHKVHPKAYRIREIADWNSRGFYKNLPGELEEDFKIREFSGKKLKQAAVEKIEIERFPGKINVIIYSARPGLIIGRGGEGVEQLRKELGRIILKNKNKDEKKEIKIDIKEIANPWSSAALVGQWVAQQIEKRIPFRKVLKQALSKISFYKEIKGAKIQVSGRLNGIEIARREWLKIGRLPLQTIRADIDFARTEALCTYGKIGIKVWLYKGEKIR